MTLPHAPIDWFADTLRLTGVAHTGPETQGEPAFIGKRLGLLNGSSWVTPWANYFGRLFVPGAHLINVGNEAVQINFMEAHARGLPTPPQSNIDAFVRYARDLAELGHVDAILITCSTMNRSFPAVVEAMRPYAIPVIQIDRPMMESAVRLLPDPDSPARPRMRPRESSRSTPSHALAKRFPSETCVTSPRTDKSGSVGGPFAAGLS